MFSIKTRRRIVTGLIVLVYAGILAFVPLVMWPQMKQNRTDIQDLEAGRDQLTKWNAEIESGEFEATKAQVQNRQERLDKVKDAYQQMNEYCMERDRILERPELLDTSSPYNFKQDYLSLLNHWQENSPERPGTEETDEMTVEPSYAWATKEGAMPALADYDEIIKETAVVDAVVRTFVAGRARFRLTSVTVEKARDSVEAPGGGADVRFGAARYKVWPAEVTALIPFSADYRTSIEQVATAPQHAVKAPRSVGRHPEEPRYRPVDEQNYILPCVTIRSIEFAPAEVNWIKVTIAMDVHDFSAKEPTQ